MPRWRVQISCNRTVLACSCITWLEWDGAWMRKITRDWRCTDAA